MKTINFSNLTLKQRVGQLLFVRPNKLKKEYLTELYVGGIFLSKQKSKEKYKNSIKFFKKNSDIKLFFATDMEGYWNNFSKFYKSKTFGQIKNKVQAQKLGESHSKILKQLGFNVNFSPVTEVRNTVWPGRSFTGTDKEIKEKISSYIKGIHKYKVLATAKHYPGGNLVRNPHLVKYKINATRQELEMFDEAIKAGVDMIMIGHPIIYGELDSKEKQATISPEIIKPLKKKFPGLIITDAVTMLALRKSYFWNFKKVYPDLVRAGNDLILDTHINSSYKKIKKRRDEILKQAKKDSTLRKRINESAKKILKQKGYRVIN